jgi:hypothetical protein
LCYKDIIVSECDAKFNERERVVGITHMIAIDAAEKEACEYGVDKRTLCIHDPHNIIVLDCIADPMTTKTRKDYFG